MRSQYRVSCNSLRQVWSGGPLLVLGTLWYPKGKSFMFPMEYPPQTMNSKQLSLLFLCSRLQSLRTGLHHVCKHAFILNVIHLRCVSVSWKTLIVQYFYMVKSEPFLLGGPFQSKLSHLSSGDEVIRTSLISETMLLLENHPPCKYQGSGQAIRERCCPAAKQC